MTSINYNAAASSQLPMMVPPRGFAADAKTQAADELRERFTQFVGEAFFGQMIKAMRATVGKPAYFHGGRAEEVFQGQLDQKLAEHLTEASATRFAEPMFERQFPHLVEQNRPSDLSQLTQLRRG
jgi:Rod binding domain-containing protein